MSPSASMTPGRPGRRRRGWLVPAFLLLAAPLRPAGAPPPEEPAVLKAMPPDERLAREVLVNWMEQIGGAEEVRDLRTAFIKATIDSGNGTPPLPLLIRGAPNAYRLEYELPVLGQLVQACDGTVAWQQNEKLGFGFPDAQQHYFNRTLTDFRVTLRTGQIYPKRRALPREKVDGRELQPLLMTLANGREEKWFFDPATGYRVRIEVRGDDGPLVILFDDFRRAFGARVIEPYRITTIQGARRTTIATELILYNEGMDPGLFAPPLMAAEENTQLQLLLARNAAARGAGLLGEVQTRITEREDFITTSGTRVPTTVFLKRPNLIAIRQESPGLGTTWQGYDGKIGWAWNEVEGYREMQGAELQHLIHAADLDGPLKLSASCPFRKLLGESWEGGRRLIGVALASLRGVEGNFYFDAENNDLVRIETFMQAGESGVLKVTAGFGDYRRVDGVLLPFRTTLDNPALRIVTTVKSVRHNEPIDDAVFAPRKE